MADHRLTFSPDVWCDSSGRVEPAPLLLSDPHPQRSLRPPQPRGDDQRGTGSDRRGQPEEAQADGLHPWRSDQDGLRHWRSDYDGIRHWRSDQDGGQRRKVLGVVFV